MEMLTVCAAAVVVVIAVAVVVVAVVVIIIIIIYWFGVIFRVRIVFRKTVVGDRRFYYLSGSQLTLNMTTAQVVETSGCCCCCCCCCCHCYYYYYCYLLVWRDRPGEDSLRKTVVGDRRFDYLSGSQLTLKTNI